MAADGGGATAPSPLPVGRDAEQKLLWVRLKKGDVLPIRPTKSVINSSQNQCLENKKRTATLRIHRIKRLRLALEQTGTSGKVKPLPGDKIQGAEL